MVRQSPRITFSAINSALGLVYICPRLAVKSKECIKFKEVSRSLFVDVPWMSFIFVFAFAVDISDRQFMSPHHNLWHKEDEDQSREGSFKEPCITPGGTKSASHHFQWKRIFCIILCWKSHHHIVFCFSYYDWTAHLPILKWHSAIIVKGRR